MIAENTPYSIHWLLTGEGEKFVSLDGNDFELTDEIRDFIREVCMEAINCVSVEVKSDKHKKIFFLSSDKIKQEKMLEESELLEKED